MQPCLIDNGLQHHFGFGSVTPFSPRVFLSQVEVEHRLDRLLLGVRLGPMLGLAGTLIPLGPTLLALTAWDLSALSSQLVIAFNATVVGLFIGGACYAVHLIRRRWYRADLADLDFVVTRLES
jgi:biopolymer transport protein ExbB/TolQ